MGAKSISISSSRSKNSQEYKLKSIKISMSKLVQDMEPVAVPKHVKDDLDAPLEANEHSPFLGGVGQLQWLQVQGNPLLSFATGILQSRSATPMVMIS